MRTEPQSMADLVFQLDWESEMATHTEIHFAENVNFWRDSFPDQLHEDLMNKTPGEKIKRNFLPGAFLPLPDKGNVFDITESQFGRKSQKICPSPCIGRFYPKGILTGVLNVFSQNIEPFRVLRKDGTKIRVDCNHPMAGKPIRLSATIQQISPKKNERGGSSTDWTEILTKGAGMQARWEGHPTDFFSDHPFQRRDEKADSLFYTSPRFISHIDDHAKEVVRKCYHGYLKEGMRVLDLMGSWESHLPGDLEFCGVTGLGINRSELLKNQILTDYIVHDLNHTPSLPFDSESYDVVVCTSSVEYLTQPFEVFREVHRILKPGGHFVVVFSNRWFPPKVVKIWTGIHEFERMGLVTEYFMESGGFTRIETFSSSGFPRPKTDKYYGEYLYSDPIYSVAGQKR